MHSWPTFLNTSTLSFITVWRKRRSVSELITNALAWILFTRLLKGTISMSDIEEGTGFIQYSIEFASAVLALAEATFKKAILYQKLIIHCVVRIFSGICPLTSEDFFRPSPPLPHSRWWASRNRLCHPWVLVYRNSLRYSTWDLIWLDLPTFFAHPTVQPYSLELKLRGWSVLQNPDMPQPTQKIEALPWRLLIQPLIFLTPSDSKSFVLQIDKISDRNDGKWHSVRFASLGVNRSRTQSW